MIHIERDSADWHRAWNALQATGRQPDDGWMLMHAEQANVVGGLRFFFKNHDLPFMTDDPAYDGRIKYIQIPN